MNINKYILVVALIMTSTAFAKSTTERLLQESRKIQMLQLKVRILGVVSLLKALPVEESLKLEAINKVFCENMLLDLDESQEALQEKINALEDLGLTLAKAGCL